MHLFNVILHANKKVHLSLHALTAISMRSKETIMLSLIWDIVRNHWNWLPHLQDSLLKEPFGMVGKVSMSYMRIRHKQVMIISVSISSKTEDQQFILRLSWGKLITINHSPTFYPSSNIEILFKLCKVIIVLLEITDIQFKIQL